MKSRIIEILSMIEGDDDLNKIFYIWKAISSMEDGGLDAEAFEYLADYVDAIEKCVLELKELDEKVGLED